MRSRNVKCTSIDPIQKMEVYDSYSYVTNGFNVIERETDAHDVQPLPPPVTLKQEAFDLPVKKLPHKRKNSESISSSSSPSSPMQQQQPPPLLNHQGSVSVVNLLQSPENHHHHHQHNAMTKKQRVISSTTAMDLLTTADTGEIGDRIINDDYHFLLSLQPFMSELSPIQKLRLRMKIQKLVFEELYANENQL